MKLIKIRKHVWMIVLIGFFSFNFARPIDERVAMGIGGVSGVGIFAALVRGNFCHCPSDYTLSCVSTACAAFFIYEVLLQFTPKGRFYRAIKKVGRAESNAVFNKNFASQEEAISFIKNWYRSYKKPLVVLQSDLERSRKDLLYARDLLVSAISEKELDVEFCKKCENYISKIDFYCKTINRVIEIIPAIKIVPGNQK